MGYDSEIGVQRDSVVKMHESKHRSYRTMGQAGFSLLELSIVLVIIALMVGFGLEIGLSTLKTSEINVTKQRLAQVKEAIELYQANNGRFPCPAPLNAIPGAAAFGIEDNCANPPAAGLADVAGGDGTASAVRVGMLPIKNLNLPEDYAKDAWNNKILYAVTKSLAVPAYAGNGNVQVEDSSGNLVTVLPERAAWFSASHGPNQEGAVGLRLAAAAIACNATVQAKDDENCDADALFFDTQFNDGDVAAQYFDDFAVWGGKK